MEIEPAKQKTRPDFEMTEQHWGVRAVDTSEVSREGRRLLYLRDGKETPISRIDLFEALALGVKSYFEKTRAFRSLGIALSGGRDSMLTLLVAWRAAQMIQGDAKAAGGIITAFYMPSRFSQESTRTAAQVLAEELGVELRVVPIDDAFGRELDITRDMLKGAEPSDLTQQNIQARLRGQRMWN